MNIAQSLDNLKLEQDAVVLYDALSSIESDPRRAAAFRHIADNRRRHADIWAMRLRDLGAVVPPATAADPGAVHHRAAKAARDGRRVGARPGARGRRGGRLRAAGGPPEIEAIAADEREHAAIWKRLGDEPSTNGTRRRGPSGRTMQATAVVAAAHPPVVRGAAERPGDHARRGLAPGARSGTLRAIIFGVSDGLVSNLALVMGVAGASDDGRLILFTASPACSPAFSMAAGEYISMQSQRELFERQIALERASSRRCPRRSSRSSPPCTWPRGSRARRRSASRAHLREPGAPLDTLVREELGLDPDELGSPWGAAFGSFTAFAIGAMIPVLPYLFGGRDRRCSSRASS